ncbi:MAG: phage portal protein, partial [Proteobacteria bacterium]|nr:phage portal protein [Pseudomonadota bacterium]
MSFGRSLYNGWTSVMSHWIALSDPQRAFAYTRQREVLLSYKAASKKGPNRAWRGDNRSADEVLLRDWKDVTARARELVQSSSHIAGALEKICSNVIYTGIVPQAQLKKSNGVFDKVRNDAVESRFSKWARSKKVRWFEKVKLVLRHLWQDGEILVHWFIDPTMLEEGLVPLRVELLEADHFDASVHGQLRNGNYARRGIEFDATGDPVAYHLFTEHPGNCGAMLLAETRRIPADNIIHIFEPKRASQTRGISWLYAVIMRMRDLDEYEESERIAARLTSAFAFFL